MKKDLELQIKGVRSGWVNAFSNMKDVVKDAVKNLRESIDEVDHRHSNSLVHHPAGPPDLSGIHEDIDKLDDKIEKFREDLSKIESDKNNIQFQNLGFKDPGEANTWIGDHCPHGKYGLMVDFHTMLEHIEQKIKGVDALGRLEKVHKIHLPSNSEAVAIDSFQSMIPRFFCKPGEHYVIDSTESHFSNIKSFKDWNNPSSGFKLQLKNKWKGSGSTKWPPLSQSYLLLLLCFPSQRHQFQIPLPGPMNSLTTLMLRFPNIPTESLARKRCGM